MPPPPPPLFPRMSDFCMRRRRRRRRYLRSTSEGGGRANYARKVERSPVVVVVVVTSCLSCPLWQSNIINYHGRVTSKQRAGSQEYDIMLNILQEQIHIKIHYAKRARKRKSLMMTEPSAKDDHDSLNPAGRRRRRRRRRRRGRIQVNLAR